MKQSGLHAWLLYAGLALCGPACFGAAQDVTSEGLAALSDNEVTTVPHAELPWAPFLAHFFYPDGSYQSDQIAGPFVENAHLGHEAYSTLRPLFIDTYSTQRREQHVLYPIYNRYQTELYHHWNIFSLIESTHYRSGVRSARFFPFYFYKDTGNPESSYRGILPLGGNVRQFLWMDELSWWGFPLYVKTQKNGRIKTYRPWPFIQSMHGEDASGFGLWPLYGSFKQGERWRHFYWFWPLGFHKKEKTPSGQNRIVEGFLPFYYSRYTPSSLTREHGWPFFGYTAKWTPADEGDPSLPLSAPKRPIRGRRQRILERKAAKKRSIPLHQGPRIDAAEQEDPNMLSQDEYRRDSDAWSLQSSQAHLSSGNDLSVQKRCTYYEVRMPWPFIVHARGDEAYENRFLPAYSYRKDAYAEKRWLMWPAFKSLKWTESGIRHYKNQVFYFIVSSERQYEANTQFFLGEKSHFWPLVSDWKYGHERRQIQALSPFEVFFPHNETIRRLYSPLFALYRYDADYREGMYRHHLLFNCFTYERGPMHRSWTLGPLLSWHRDASLRRLSIFNGLIQYEARKGKKGRLEFFVPREKKRRTRKGAPRD